MHKSYHVCVSSPDEVMFRSEKDYARVSNCLALSLHSMDSRLLADSFMSNHYHLAVISDDLGEFVKSFRESYGKYFNYTYGRKGFLGDSHYFSIELCGLYHTLSAIDYILRNPVHHGVCVTPFEYEYNSSKCYFKKELGYNHKYHFLDNETDIKKFLPVNRSLPEGYRMNESGIIVQEQYIESSIVEKMYASSRSYLFRMNRKSNEEWLEEQKKDGNESEPVTLEMIEEGTKLSVIDMMRNEKRIGAKNRISDLEVCKIIDGIYVPRFRKRSYLFLSDREKEIIWNDLRMKYLASDSQIKRCLHIK